MRKALMNLLRQCDTGRPGATARSSMPWPPTDPLPTTATAERSQSSSDLLCCQDGNAAEGDCRPRHLRARRLHLQVRAGVDLRRLHVHVPEGSRGSSPATRRSAEGACPWCAACCGADLLREAGHGRPGCLHVAVQQVPQDPTSTSARPGGSGTAAGGLARAGRDRSPAGGHAAAGPWRPSGARHAPCALAQQPHLGRRRQAHVVGVQVDQLLCPAPVSYSTLSITASRRPAGVVGSGCASTCVSSSPDM